MFSRVGTRTGCCYLGDGAGASDWAASGGVVFDDYDYDQVVGVGVGVGLHSVA